MEEKDYEILDNAVNYTILYFQSTYHGVGVWLNNFDIKNEEHLCLLRIAGIYQQFMKGNIYVRCGLFNFLKLKKRYKSKMNIVWHRKNSGDTCDNIISIIEDVTRPGIFKEVFHEYYNN